MDVLTLNFDFNKYFSEINFKFSKPQTKHLSTFIEGTITSEGKKTLTDLSKNSMFPKNRSSFNKFLIYSPWDEKELNKARKENSLNAMKKANKNQSPYFFIIDDTISLKNISTKKMEGLSRNFSHVSGKSEWSHCIVSLHGHSNGLSLPLEFKQYFSKENCKKQKDREFKTKIELALDTLKDIDLQKTKDSYVLVDSWYSSQGFINESQRSGFQVIGALKSNRIFYPNGIKDKLNEFSERVNGEIFDVVTVKGIQHHVYRYEGPIKDIENIVVLIIWQEKNGELRKPFYIACTNTALTTKEIIEYYGYRWEIEVAFRYQKQRLGLEDYEMRTLKGIKRFWSLIYLVYNFLELKRYRSKIKENLGSIIDKFKSQKKSDFLSYIYNKIKEGKSKEELLLQLGIPA